MVLSRLRGARVLYGVLMCFAACLVLSGCDEKEYVFVDTEYTVTGDCPPGCTNVKVDFGDGTVIAATPLGSDKYEATHTYTTPYDYRQVKCSCDNGNTWHDEVKVVVMKPKMKLELDILFIQTDNKYSENRLIFVTAVDPRNGNTFPGFVGTVNIAEDGTSIYTQNGGSLPASITFTAPDQGVKNFWAESLADAQTPYTTRPDPAKIKTTNYDVYGGQSLEVEQWCDDDSDGCVDWCEAWVVAIFDHYKTNGIAEVKFVMGLPTVIGPDIWDPTARGLVEWDTTRIQINPAATKHRLNTDKELTRTVLHEARHVYQNWETNRWVGTDHDGLIDDPDNDDDPRLLAYDGDCLPELVTYGSANNPDGIQDEVDVGNGDGTWDDFETIAEPAIEGDADEFMNLWDSGP